MRRRRHRTNLGWRQFDQKDMKPSSLCFGWRIRSRWLKGASSQKSSRTTKAARKNWRKGL